MNKLLLLPLLWTAMVSAQTVYRTVNEAGVVSFSDSPPADDQEVEELVLDVAPAQDSQLYRQRLEAMRRATDRMAQDRRSREQQRAQLREAAAQTRTPPAGQPDLIDRYIAGWPKAGSSYHRRSGSFFPHGGRYPYRPPVVVAPVPELPRGRNSQLMRPILPRPQ